MSDLLDFARGRLGGGIPISPRSCQMGALCEDVVEEIRQGNPARTITLEASGDLGVEWDPDRIEQVLANLIGNAITHGLDPIVVTCWPEAEHVVTAVHNRGEPIPDALLPTLFEPFTRGAYLSDDHPEDAIRGLGLGLYIANEIVLAHGGTLAVSSNTDGTTFTFVMPRSVPRRPRTTTGEEPPLAR